MQKLNNKKGFSLIELASVLAVIAILIVAVASGSGMRETARVQSAAESIRTLRGAAENYIASGNLTYTGMDIAALKSSSFLPSGFTGTGTNPFGGDYSIGPNATDATKFDVSLTAVTSSVDTKLTSLFNSQADSISYDGTSQTWTVTF